MADTPKKAASQDDIDALIRDAQGRQAGVPPPPTAATQRTPSVSLDDIDALIREAQAAQGLTATVAAVPPKPMPTADLSAASKPAAPVPSAVGATTASIAQSDIDDLLKEIAVAT